MLSSCPIGCPHPTIACFLGCRNSCTAPSPIQRHSCTAASPIRRYSSILALHVITHSTQRNSCTVYFTATLNTLSKCPREGFFACFLVSPLCWCVHMNDHGSRKRVEATRRGHADAAGSLEGSVNSAACQRGLSILAGPGQAMKICGGICLTLRTSGRNSMWGRMSRSAHVASQHTTVMAPATQPAAPAAPWLQPMIWAGRQAAGPGRQAGRTYVDAWRNLHKLQHAGTGASARLLLGQPEHRPFSNIQHGSPVGCSPPGRCRTVQGRVGHGR